MMVHVGNPFGSYHWAHEGIQALRIGRGPGWVGGRGRSLGLPNQGAALAAVSLRPFEFVRAWSQLLLYLLLYLPNTVSVVGPAYQVPACRS